MTRLPLCRFSPAGGGLPYQQALPSEIEVVTRLGKQQLVQFTLLIGSKTVMAVNAGLVPSPRTLRRSRACAALLGIVFTLSERSVATDLPRSAGTMTARLTASPESLVSCSGLAGSRFAGLQCLRTSGFREANTCPR